MTLIRTSEDVKVAHASLTGIHHSYDYPGGLNFAPDGEIHDKIVALVMEKAELSKTMMRKHYPMWRQVDEMNTAYIPLDDYEQRIKEVDSRKPLSMVLPMSFATLETLLTYMVQAFLDQLPVFQYEGFEPQDTLKAKMLELVVQQQLYNFKGELGLYTMFRDALNYGVGAVIPYWRQVLGKKIRPVQEVVENEDGGIMNSIFSAFMRNTPTLRTSRAIVSDEVLFEGNDIRPIDPYMLLLDPDTGVVDFQEGESFGWIEFTNRLKVLTDERDGNGFFNCKYLENLTGQSRYAQDESHRGERWETSNVRSTSTITSPITLVREYLNIIPKDHKLSTDEYPQRWLFTVAQDNLLIQAEPVELAHGQYPAAIAAPESDGHTLVPISRMEVLLDSNKLANWFINSHVANIRKALNDVIIYDPSLIETQDLLAPGEGKAVRLKRAAWGRGVKDVAYQLNIHDVTQTHMRDLPQIIDIIQTVGGAADPNLGKMRSGGERRSATEARAAVTGAMSRMGMLARLISIQALRDLGRMMAIQTQQLMEVPLYARAVGDWKAKLSQEYGMATSQNIDPMDILVDVDVVVRDGSLPVDTTGISSSWIQLYQIAAANPEVAPNLDFMRIFLHISRLLGAKNVSDFMKGPLNVQSTVLPNEEVSRGAERGNLVPVEQLAGAGPVA